MAIKHKIKFKNEDRDRGTSPAVLRSSGPKQRPERVATKLGVSGESARRSVSTDDMKPMTLQEEYRNADVPMPKEPGKRFTEWLSEPVDDRGDLDLTKQIDVLKTQQDILIQKLDMAAHVVKQLEARLLDKEKENDRLVEEIQLAEMALNPSKK